MKDIQGKLTGDSGWAVPQKARLQMGPSGVAIAVGDGGTLHADWSHVGVKASVMDEAESILEAHTADGRSYAFEARSVPLLKALRTHAPAGPLHAQASAIDGLQSTARRTLWRQMSVVLTLFALVVGTFVGGLLYMPTFLAERIPLEWEEQLGQTTLGQVKGEGTVLTSGPAVDAVNTVWKRLEPGLEKSPYTFRITVVDAPIVNAFAMPGGYVVVYTGLLDELDTPEALAGILGHEAQHVIHKHSLKALVRTAQWQLGFGTLTTLFGGSREAATLQTLQKVAGNVDSLAYSRANESEADQESVRALVRAGIDPVPFSNFFHILARKEGSHFAILSTHPPSEGRAATLQSFARTLEPYQSTPIDVDWKKLQKSIRALDKIKPVE